VEEKILSNLQERIFLEKECAFESRIINLELESLERAIFKIDDFTWTDPEEAKEVPIVNIPTPKLSEPLNGTQDPSVDVVKVDPVSKPVKLSPTLLKKSEKKTTHAVKGKSVENVLPKRNDSTRDAKRVGTDKAKSVKPPTSPSRRNQTKEANSTPKPNSSNKPFLGLNFTKSTFEIGENSKAKLTKPISPFKNCFPTLVKPSSNSKSVPVTDKRRNEGRTNVKQRDLQKESWKPSTKNFNASPKRHSPRHAGLGYVPSAHFSNHKNVKANSGNNAFMNFNKMFSLIRNYMCDGFGFPRASSPKSQRRKKRNFSRSASPHSTTSPTPKEKSEKGTSSKANSDTNPKEPNWQWVPKIPFLQVSLCASV
jgi:hypothetical protein